MNNLLTTEGDVPSDMSLVDIQAAMLTYVEQYERPLAQGDTASTGGSYLDLL